MYIQDLIQTVYLKIRKYLFLFKNGLFQVKFLFILENVNEKL